MTPPRDDAAHGDEEQDKTPSGEPLGVSVERVAERVYRLMMREIQRDRSRGAADNRRSGG